MKRIASGAVAAVGVLTFIVAGLLTPANAAHGGGEEKVGVCHRTASESNPYVYIEVPADEANGHITGEGKQHNDNVTWRKDGTWRGVEHKAGDPKRDYLAPEGRADCRDKTTEEPPNEPPPCDKDDVCHMPVMDDSEGDVVCKGSLAGGVYDNVTVPRGATCAIHGAYVNGDVVARDSRNLLVFGTPVRGDVKALGVKGDVYVGSVKTCAYDPFIGGSFIAKRSHNVLGCHLTVCHKIRLVNNDGRVTIRNSTARRIDVIRHTRFNADKGAGNHVRPEAIRLLNVTTPLIVDRGNTRPLVNRG